MPDEKLKAGDTVTLSGTVRGVYGDRVDVEIGDPNDKEAAYRPNVSLVTKQVKKSGSTAASPGAAGASGTPRQPTPAAKSTP